MSGKLVLLVLLALQASAMTTAADTRLGTRLEIRSSGGIAGTGLGMIRAEMLMRRLEPTPAHVKTIGGGRERVNIALAPPAVNRASNLPEAKDRAGRLPYLATPS